MSEPSVQRPRGQTAWHSLSTNEVCAQLGVDPQSGLGKLFDQRDAPGMPAVAGPS
jgi:hypothetical protein